MKFTGSKIYFKSQRKRICYGIFLLFIIGGIILGTVLVSSTDNLTEFQRLLFNHNIFKSKPKLSFMRQFLRGFSPMLMLLAVQLFAGYSAFGQVFTVLTLIYRGTACGISSAFIYLTLGIKGVLAVLVTILPFGAVSALILILGAREAVKQSNKIADYAFYGGVNCDESPDTKLYLLKFGILGIFSLLAAVADTVITYFLKDVFF